MNLTRLGLLVFTVWIVSGVLMYLDHKDDYKLGYSDGYQARINYERGMK